jgi:Ca-activated chloride channel family protein
MKPTHRISHFVIWSMFGSVVACSGSAVDESSKLGAPPPQHGPFAGPAGPRPNSANPTDDIAYAAPGNANVAGDSVAAPGLPNPSGPLGAAGPAGGIALPPKPAPPTSTANPDPTEAPVVQPAVNPFVHVEHDPLSTFAVDVDTASYDIFRRDVLAGHLPSPQTVRLEEFVNYFDYDYPAPEPNAPDPFSISLAAAPGLFGNTTLLRVGIQGERAPEFEKKPANLVFLVDVSGSMASAEKLPLVQGVLTQTLSILEPNDTVSIVTYASGTGVALAPTPASERATIENVITNLTAGGSTNGAGGIQLAYQQAEDAFIDGGINHIVLCTDGDFNVGVSSTEGLIDLIEEKRKSGVTFTALGFGYENNDAMMEAVSNAGNGMYGVIANLDQATEYVHQRLLDNMTLIAKDVKIQVEFNPNWVTAYRLLGYENRAIADNDFRNDRVDAGEIGAEHRVTAVYELVLAGQEVPSPNKAPEPENGASYAGDVEVAENDLVLVKVRYKDVDATENDPAYEVNTTLNADAIAESATDLDADFQWTVAVAAFAEILKGSPYASQDALPAIGELIAAQSSRDAARGEFKELFTQATTLLKQR